MNQPVQLLEPATVLELEARPGQPLTTVRASAVVVSPSDLLRIAMESGDKDLDRMERLMKMAQEWRGEEARVAFREDFAAFKAENIVVPKTKKVEQRKKDGGAGPSYWQSEMETVAALLQPALSRHGFGYRFDVQFQRAEGSPWCEVTCKLEHRLGHVETVTLGGPPDDSGAKNPLQEMQSTSTFLQRHALLAITGTAQAGHDNDGRGARGYKDDEAGAPSAETLTLITQGEAEAKKGTKVLLAWWQKLSNAQREPLMADFSRMRAEAAKIDKGGVK